jgi:hypothetical protein
MSRKSFSNHSCIVLSRKMPGKYVLITNVHTVVIKPPPMTFTCNLYLHVNVIGDGLITIMCVLVINAYLSGFFLP